MKTIIIITILIILYILSIIFAKYSYKKAWEGKMKGCEIDFIDVIIVFIPMFNLVTAFSLKEQWSRKQNEYKYYKFFKIKHVTNHN